MEEVKRYDLIRDPNNENNRLEECEDGVLMYYHDHKSALADARRDEQEAVLKELVLIESLEMSKDGKSALRAAIAAIRAREEGE